MKPLGFVIAALAALAPSVSYGQAIPNKCEMMWGDLGKPVGADRPTQLQRASFDALPPSVHDLLPPIRPEKGSYVVYQLPTTNEEYQRLYPARLISKSVQEEIARARSAFPQTQLQQGRAMSASTFGQSISNAESDVVTVIGHNVEGRFAFVDGTTRSLVDLAEDCGAARKLCIFLSCNAAKLLRSGGVGVARSITFDEAITMAKVIEAKLLARGSAQITYANVERLVKDLDSSGARAHVTVVALKGCGAAGTGIGIVYAVDSVGQPASQR